MSEHDPIRALRRQQISQNIRSIMTDLKKGEAAESRLMPANVFVAYYLPFWRGQIPDEATNIERYNLWMTIAGGPNGRVKIVDPNNGNVIATSPPAAPTEIFAPSAPEKGVTMAGIMGATRQTAIYNPNTAELMLLKQLSGRLVGMTKDAGPIALANAKAWDEFLSVFEPKKKQAQETVSTAQGASAKQIDDGLYADDY